LFGSQHFSKYLFIVCVRKSNRFGTMWGWINDHRTFIFGITFPLICKQIIQKHHKSIKKKSLYNSSVVQSKLQIQKIHSRLCIFRYYSRHIVPGLTSIYAKCHCFSKSSPMSSILSHFIAPAYSRLHVY